MRGCATSVSKFGGYPYLSPGEAYPTLAGEPIVLLAQINWAEVPPLPDYPTSGILQIFIPREHEFYGADFDAEPGERLDWTLRWYPEPGQTQMSLSFLPDDAKLHGAPAQTPLEFPIDALTVGGRGLCYRLVFEAASGPVLSEDGRFKPLISTPDTAWDFWRRAAGGSDNAGQQLIDAYDALHAPIGTKIGGYAGFTQNDPRPIPDQVSELEGKGAGNSWELLLQMDSGPGIMWGDVGVGNFFIRRNDLLQQDFSRVWYDWDCC